MEDAWLCKGGGGMMMRLQVARSVRDAFLVRPVALLFSLALSGGVEQILDGPVWPQDVKPTPAIRQEVMSFYVAAITAKSCPSLSIRPEAQELLADRVDDMYRDAGVIVMTMPSPGDIVSRDEAYEYVTAYREKRGFKEDDEAGWCAAGNSEIAHKTQIGSFLKKTS